MMIELSTKERNLILDGLEDTLYRLNHPNKKGIPEKNKIYRNAVKRLKGKIEFSFTTFKDRQSGGF